MTAGTVTAPGNAQGIAVQGTTEIRVRYAETDAMAVAHHATYPVWFEVGRGNLMRERGLPYSDIEARGFYFMLTGLNVQYRRAARYDDLLRLTTRVAEIRSRTMKFAYELHKLGSDTPELVATGETHHIATDLKYRPARIPDDVLALFGWEK